MTLGQDWRKTEAKLPGRTSDALPALPFSHDRMSPTSHVYVKVGEPAPVRLFVAHPADLYSSSISSTASDSFVGWSCGVPDDAMGRYTLCDSTEKFSRSDRQRSTATAVSVSLTAGSPELPKTCRPGSHVSSFRCTTDPTPARGEGGGAPNTASHDRQRQCKQPSPPLPATHSASPEAHQGASEVVMERRSQRRPSSVDPATFPTLPAVWSPTPKPPTEASRKGSSMPLLQPSADGRNESLLPNPNGRCNSAHWTGLLAGRPPSPTGERAALSIPSDGDASNRVEEGPTQHDPPSHHPVRHTEEDGVEEGGGIRVTATAMTKTCRSQAEDGSTPVVVKRSVAPEYPADGTATGDRGPQCTRLPTQEKLQSRDGMQDGLQSGSAAACGVERAPLYAAQEGSEAGKEVTSPLEKVMKAPDATEADCIASQSALKVGNADVAPASEVLLRASAMRKQSSMLSPTSTLTRSRWPLPVPTPLPSVAPPSPLPQRPAALASVLARRQATPGAAFPNPRAEEKECKRVVHADTVSAVAPLRNMDEEIHDATSSGGARRSSEVDPHRSLPLATAASITGTRVHRLRHSAAKQLPLKRLTTDDDDNGDSETTHHKTGVVAAKPNASAPGRRAILYRTVLPPSEVKGSSKATATPDDVATHDLEPSPPPADALVSVDVHKVMLVNVSKRPPAEISSAPGENANEVTAPRTGGVAPPKVITTTAAATEAEEEASNPLLTSTTFTTTPQPTSAAVLTLSTDLAQEMPSRRSPPKESSSGDPMMCCTLPPVLEKTQVGHGSNGGEDAHGRGAHPAAAAEEEGETSHQCNTVVGIPRGGSGGGDPRPVSPTADEAVSEEQNGSWQKKTEEEEYEEEEYEEYEEEVEEDEEEEEIWSRSSRRTHFPARRDVQHGFKWSDETLACTFHSQRASNDLYAEAEELCRREAVSPTQRAMHHLKLRKTALLAVVMIDIDAIQASCMETRGRYVWVRAREQALTAGHRSAPPGVVPISDVRFNHGPSGGRRRSVENVRRAKREARCGPLGGSQREGLTRTLEDPKMLDALPDGEDDSRRIGTAGDPFALNLVREEILQGDSIEMDETVSRTSGSKVVLSVALEMMATEWVAGHNTCLLLGNGERRSTISVSIAVAFLEKAMELLRGQLQDSASEVELRIRMGAVSDRGEDGRRVHTQDLLAEVSDSSSSSEEEERPHDDNKLEGGEGSSVACLPMLGDRVPAQVKLERSPLLGTVVTGLHTVHITDASANASEAGSVLTGGFLRYTRASGRSRDSSCSSNTLSSRRAFRRTASVEDPVVFATVELKKICRGKDMSGSQLSARESAVVSKRMATTTHSHRSAEFRADVFVSSLQLVFFGTEHAVLDELVQLPDVYRTSEGEGEWNRNVFLGNFSSPPKLAPFQGTQWGSAFTFLASFLGEALGGGDVNTAACLSIASSDTHAMPWLRTLSSLRRLQHSLPQRGDVRSCAERINDLYDALSGLQRRHDRENTNRRHKQLSRFSVSGKRGTPSDSTSIFLSYCGLQWSLNCLERMMNELHIFLDNPRLETPLLERLQKSSKGFVVAEPRSMEELREGLASGDKPISYHSA